MRFPKHHPVLTPEGVKLAGDIAAGGDVIITLPCGDTQIETLTSVRNECLERCEVDELTFDPDQPVESFLELAEKILSKGPSHKAAWTGPCRRQVKRLNKLKAQIQQATPVNSDNEQDPTATSSAGYVQPAMPTHSD